VYGVALIRFRARRSCRRSYWRVSICLTRTWATKSATRSSRSWSTVTWRPAYHAPMLGETRVNASGLAAFDSSTRTARACSAWTKIRAISPRCFATSRLTLLSPRTSYCRCAHRFLCYMILTLSVLGLSFIHTQLALVLFSRFLRRKANDSVVYHKLHHLNVI